MNIQQEWEDFFYFLFQIVKGAVIGITGAVILMVFFAIVKALS